MARDPIGKPDLAATALRAQHRSEALAARLPPLLVAAERVAATVAQGVHGRRRVGTGETFWQYRRYEIGDSATMIDWRQSGKTQPVFVRENEWEAAQSVWLWHELVILDGVPVGPRSADQEGTGGTAADGPGRSAGPGRRTGGVAGIGRAAIRQQGDPEPARHEDS